VRGNETSVVNFVSSLCLLFLHFTERHRFVGAWRCCWHCYSSTETVEAFLSGWIAHILL